MKLSNSSMIDLLRSADPDPEDSPAPPAEVLHERARRLTAGAPQATHVARSNWRLPVRPILIAAAAVAALALVVPALVPGSAQRAKATPPVLTFVMDTRNGPSLLHAMAGKLRTQPATPQAMRQRGAVLTSDGYALATSDSGSGNTTSAWFSRKITTEVQIDAATGDGTTRIATEETEPHFASDADRKAWTESGAGGGSGDHTTTEPSAPDTAAWYTHAPLAKQAFLTMLFNGQPDRSTDMLLASIAENLATKVLEPSQRAAVLDELADRGDVHYLGTTTDRAGRPAYGFGYDSSRAGLPTRHILLISPNGDLLAYEQVLTQDAGKLDVAIPATISYSLYLSAKYR